MGDRDPTTTGVINSGVILTPRVKMLYPKPTGPTITSRSNILLIT